MTLFPAEPEVIAPWLLVIRVLDPAAQYTVGLSFMAQSVRQIEEIASGYVDRMEPGWQLTDAFLASSPVRVAPSPRQIGIPYRS